jgi:N-carbamoylputrescine amidase
LAEPVPGPSTEALGQLAGELGVVLANGCYVVSVNRAGHEGDPAGGIEFWGQSFAADPSGTVLARAAADREELLIVPLDLDRLDFTRTHRPFLRDRRIDAYGEITRRYLGD